MRVAMAEYGRAHSTRPRAAELRSKLEASISKSADTLVVIDLAGVQMFSISFGDELFAELVKRAQAHRYGVARWVAFAGADEFAEEQLDQVLKNAKLAALLATADRKVKLVGDVEPRVRQTFEAIEQKGEATTSTLKIKLRSASLQATNNWLARLVRSKVVQRDQVGRGTGRPYVYRSRSPQLLAMSVT
jgi:hypothetical protein